MITITDSYLHVFGKEIPYYGICFVAGFALSSLIALLNCKKGGISGWEAVFSGVFAGVGAIIGAKLLSVLVSLNIIIEYRLTLKQIMQNGFVFYGGLIGGIAGLFIYCKIYKLPFLRYTDVFAPAVPLGHAVGRIGCLFSGCCYGINHDGFFSVIYLSSADVNTPLFTPLFAVQLFEALILVLIFVVCETVFLKTRKKGVASAVYLYSYAIARFLIELLRNDPARGVAGLSVSQYISVAIAAAVSVAIIARGYSDKDISA